MMRTLEPTDLAARATMQALQAARRAGVAITLLEDLEDLGTASALFDEVWGTDPANAILPMGILRAFVHAGNYAAGAFRDGEMIAAVVGFLGQDSWGPYLHSHILGVTSKRQGASIGFALKLHQRAWALEHGMQKVTWTFDPLVRRNAFFNIQKLGARADAYYERFYGDMQDEINVGDETDRVLVVWDLDGERTSQAAKAMLDEPKTPNSFDVVLSADGAEPLVRDGSGSVVACATPDDIVLLRRTDPARALRWRRALRETLGARMQEGFSVTGFTRSGLYVLDRDGDSHA